MSARFVQRAVRDVLVVDGESIVLLADSRVARLSEIGTACFQFLGRPAAVEGLAAAIKERFGAPPEGDAVAAVTAVVDELVAMGLIEEVGPTQEPAAGLPG